MTNQSRLTWLVEHRAQIQRLIHDLYLVLDDEDLRKRLETKPVDCSIFGLFVGAAFSLWRAVFLIDATRERWPDILEGAKGFLRSLVHDNAITYDREKKWNNWTIGLHLNNARYRLHRMLDDKMPGLEKTDAFKKLKAQRTTGIDNDNVQLHWETIYGALHEASFQFLKTRNLFTDQMFNSALTPADFYEPSPRPMPSKLPPLDYAAHFEVRYVSFNGGVRDTPWGRISYIDYRFRVELGLEDYLEIDRYCRDLGIDRTASCWDEDSIEFMERFAPPFYKLASASLTDLPLLRKARATARPLMISTGMSTAEEIRTAVEAVGLHGPGGRPGLCIAHSTSTFPCRLEELNLRMILSLNAAYLEAPIGCSGHETGLAPTGAAVALGASFIERHITLDRAMWGTDQAASVEIGGFERLVRNIRDIETSLGDGVKRIYESELPARRKLRRARTQ